MFKDKKIWVNWKFEKTPDGRKTKVPYQLNGKKASSIDPKTWTLYKNADEARNEKLFDGVGIILGSEEGIVGIDFDHCVKGTKIQNKEIEKFVKKAGTYCEYSPSETGLHLLFQCKENLNLERNKHSFDDEGTAIEIYNNGRYFTFTGNLHTDSKELRKISVSDFIKLIESIGYPFRKEEVPIASPAVKPINIEPDDDKLLQKIFSSKNGKAVKSLYEGDLSRHSNDHSSADFALCLHLAFWTGRDYDRIKRIWLSSPLGNRKKSQERDDYKEVTINNAIRNTSEVYTPHIKSPPTDDENEYIMSNSQHPVPILILENVSRIISKDPYLKDKFRLNDFSHMVETSWGKTEWVNLFDNAVLEVQRYISVHHPDFARVSRGLVTDAILSVAYHNKVNPPKDYLTGLHWDRKPRLNSWLHHAYGVADDELNQAIGSNWLKGMVKRVMQAGCQFDEVLALESPQGWRKSTSIKVLGGEWHVETTQSLDEKDFYMQLAQNILVEFSEGDVFDRNSVKKLKAEITKTVDQFRPPYERGMIKFKRSCVFAVTTNKLILKDETGNRRWLPVTLEKVADIEWLEENRDQLIAEAYHRVIVLGETTHEYPAGLLDDLQSSRSEWTELDETVLFWYAELSKKKRDEGVALQEALRASFPDVIKTTRTDELNIATIFRRTLKLENKNKKINGAVLKRWLPTDKTESIIKDIIKEEF